MDYWNFASNRNLEDRFGDTIREKLTIEQIEERLDFEKKKNHYLIMSNDSLRKSNHQFANTYDDLKIQLSEIIQERNMLFQKNVAQSYLLNHLNEQLTSYKEILTKTSSKNKAILVGIMSSYDELLMSTACLDKYISDIDQKTVKDSQNNDNSVDLKLALGSPRWDKVFPMNTVLSPVQEERSYHTVDSCNSVKRSRLGRNNLQKYDPNIPERLHSEEKLKGQLWEKSSAQDVHDSSHSQWIYVDTEPEPTKMESPIGKSDLEECLSTRNILSNTPAVKRNSSLKLAHIGPTFNDISLEKTFTIATQDNHFKACSTTPLRRELNIYVDPDVPEEEDDPHKSALKRQDNIKTYHCRTFFPPLDCETNFQPKRVRNELSYLDSNLTSVQPVSSLDKKYHTSPYSDKHEDFNNNNKISLSSEVPLPVKCTPAKKAISSHNKNLRKVKKIISLKKRLSVEAKRNRRKSIDALAQKVSSPGNDNVTITTKPVVKKVKSKLKKAESETEPDHSAEDKNENELITHKIEEIEKDNFEKKESNRMQTRSRRRKQERLDNINKENEIELDNSTNNRQARSRNVRKQHSSEDRAQTMKSRSKKRMETSIRCFGNNNSVNQIETSDKQSSYKENIDPRNLQSISTPKPMMDVSQPLCLNEFSISPIKKDIDIINGDGELCEYLKRAEINSPDQKTPKKKIISLSDLVKRSGSKIQSKEDRALIKKFFARFGSDDKLLAGSSKESASILDQRKIISSP